MTTPRSVNSVDDYVPLLIRSGLVSEDVAARLLSEYRSAYLPTHRKSDPITTWCAFLVASGSLTPWQCERLRHGQWKGFLFEGYLLLDWLGSDESRSCSFYLARQVATDAVVRLAISPPQPGLPPHPDFSVDHVYE